MVDSLETLTCPACGKEMKKIYVKVVDKVIDVCSLGCGGIFFDNQELKFFDESHECIHDIQEMLEGKDYTPINETKTRICPVCKVPMVKNHTSALKQIEIDECYNCGGKFLDYGELEKIRSEFYNDESRTEHFKTATNMDINAIFAEQDYELEKLKGQRSLLRTFFETFIWKS